MTLPATTVTSTGADATELMIAFVTAAKRLGNRPVPTHGIKPSSWDGTQPRPRQFAALLYVVSEDRISVSRLAERLGVSLATASQVVTDLETKGFLERVEDPTDRRRTLVQAAPAHRELTDALLDARLRPMQRALDRMSATEQQALVTGLTLLAEELEN